MDDLNITVSDSSVTSESKVVQTNTLGTDYFAYIINETQTGKANINAAINLSETTATSENVVLGIDGSINVNDAITTSENVVLETDCFISVSDSTTTSESVVMESDSLISVSDSVASSESTVMESDSLVNVSDSTTTSENIIAFETISIKVSDTTVTAESKLVLISTGGIGVLETVNTSENVAVYISQTVGADYFAYVLTKTQLGVANINQTVGADYFAYVLTKTQLGVASLIYVTKQTQTGKANLRGTKNQPGVANIRNNTQRTQTGVANLIIVGQFPQGDFKTYTSYTYTNFMYAGAESVLIFVTTRPQTGKSYITSPFTQTINFVMVVNPNSSLSMSVPSPIDINMVIE